jgi:hypothetical protein
MCPVSHLQEERNQILCSVDDGWPPQRLQVVCRICLFYELYQKSPRLRNLHILGMAPE